MTSENQYSVASQDPMVAAFENGMLLVAILTANLLC